MVKLVREKHIQYLEKIKEFQSIIKIHFPVLSISIIINKKSKDKRGLVSKTMEFFYQKGHELEDQREFVLKCSLCEIYLD